MKDPNAPLDPSKMTKQEMLDGAFFAAIQVEDFKRAKAALENGANPTTKHGPHTPLCVSVLKNRFPIVRFLVEQAGVKPAEDARVMHCGVIGEEKNPELLKYLVDHGADPDREDPKLPTPLLLALSDGLEDLARHLVNIGASVNKQSTSVEKSTPLHKACGHCSVAMVKFLLDKGADVHLETEDERRFTPLQRAIEGGSVEVVKYLLQECKVDPLHATDISPVFLATQEGNASMVELLAESGCDVNVVWEEQGIKPIHLAASNDFQDVARVLVAKGSTVDDADVRAHTPLMMASSEGYPAMVQILLDAGANPNAVAPTGSPLHHAAGAGRFEVVRLLLQAGADPELKNEGGDTAEATARAAGKESLANYILNHNLPEKERCAACYVKLEAPKRCGGCKAIWYCSTACQRSDWKARHKAACGKK